MIERLVRLLTGRRELSPPIALPTTEPVRPHSLYGVRLDRDKYPALARLLDEAGPPPHPSLELITADTIHHCREQYLREVQHMEYGKVIAKYDIDPMDLLAWQLTRGFQGQQDHLPAIQRGEYQGITPADLREAVFMNGIAGTVVNTLIKERVITSFVESLKREPQYVLRTIAETYQKQGRAP